MRACEGRSGVCLPDFFSFRGPRNRSNDRGRKRRSITRIFGVPLSDLASLPTLAARSQGAKGRLLLLRHAKSDWSGKADDHARPLSARGKRTAPRMGACMHAKGYEPELVLCSTAERTKETLELV